VTFFRCQETYIVGEDNAGPILVPNHSRPSERTHHLDIQYFASQEWVKPGLVTFFNIAYFANHADDLSDIFYRILFCHHFNRMMGYYGLPHATHKIWIDNPNDNTPSVD
jgi:hypothetical protein